MFGFLIMAAFIHGLFDFFLMHQGFAGYGWIFMIVLFMIGISLIATILNNALNISPYFDYKKSVHSSKVTARMFLYYFLLFLTQCTIVSWQKNTMATLQMVINNSYTITPIIAVTVLRLSLFKLIAGKWQPLKAELPFKIVFGEYNGTTTLIGFRIIIKGEPFNDYQLNRHIGQHVLLCPATRESHYLRKCRHALIRDKVFLNGEQAYFVTDIFIAGKSGDHETVLLQAKSSGKTSFGDYPLVSIRTADLKELTMESDQLKTPFVEWAAVRPEDNI